MRGRGVQRKARATQVKFSLAAQAVELARGREVRPAVISLNYNQTTIASDSGLVDSGLTHPTSFFLIAERPDYGIFVSRSDGA